MLMKLHIDSPYSNATSSLEIVSPVVTIHHVRELLGQPRIRATDQKIVPQQTVNRAYLKIRRFI